jgi:Macrocin-O-methyltransferase (TylF)
MKRPVEDWEFNVLGVYNVNRPGSLEEYFRFLSENDHIDGDICEVGVFRGRSLIATAMMLKEMGSKKKVYGFDSFAGFPEYHEYDHLSQFENLHKKGLISDEHYQKYLLNLEFLRVSGKEDIDHKNISSSGNFSLTSRQHVERRLDYLGLDNVILVEGDFAKTMTKDSLKDVRFSACLIDCDIYLSYMSSLPFVWDRMTKGGYIFLDEYYSLKFPGARIACEEFFKDKQDKPRQHRQIPGEFERWFVRKIYS